MKKFLAAIFTLSTLLLAAPHFASAEECNCVTVGDGHSRSEPRGCVADLAACNALPNCLGGCQCFGKCPVAASEKPIGIPLPLSTTSVPAAIGGFIRVLLGLTGTAALVMFIYGGFLYMTSAGNEERVTKGKKTIVWAILGLIAVFSAYSVVDFVIKRLQS